MVTTVIVGVDGRALGSVLTDEALKRLGVRVANHGGSYAVRLAVLGSNDDSFADAATTSVQLLVSVNGGAKLVHPGGAKLVHLTLCGVGGLSR